jgi:predicted amidohydrolase
MNTAVAKFRASTIQLSVVVIGQWTPQHFCVKMGRYSWCGSSSIVVVNGKYLKDPASNIGTFVTSFSK